MTTSFFESKDYQKEVERTMEDICSKYRGLRKNDLDEMNPWYSCVICKEGPSCGHRCTFPGLATEEEFALRYNFEEKA
jgi:hypothetical protein